MLIFFGGVDKDNLTARALKALTCTALECIAVDVVIGDNPTPGRNEELAAKRPTQHCIGNYRLAGLIARADLAIGAGGTTTWERICLKLPSLVVVVASNQLPFAQSLAKAGYIKLLGEERDTTTEQIRSTLLKSITMPIPQDEIGDLTDGWGAERIAIAMIGLIKRLVYRLHVHQLKGIHHIGLRIRSQEKSVNLKIYMHEKFYSGTPYRYITKWLSNRTDRH